jgi:hypothetical protein
MAGKTPSEAVQNFLSPLQRALSCLTNEILLVSKRGYQQSLSPHTLTLSSSPVELGRDKRLALKLVQHYRIVEYEGPRGPWKVSTVAYYYTVEDARTPGHEIFAYHWHPLAREAVHFPHFHLYQGAGNIDDAIRKAHFPTGRIAVEDVLRVLITQFDVIPLRDDWQTVLDQTSSAYDEWKTWS